MITNRKKEYLANQVNTLKQNTDQKEKQLRNLQMSAREQIGKEVQKAAKPVVVVMAKQSAVSLSKKSNL